MSNNIVINSTTFTEIELSIIAVGLYLVISPIHGVSKITDPILKMFNIKTPTSLLLFTGLLFGVSYYFLIKLVLGPLYKKIRIAGFKVGGQNGDKVYGYNSNNSIYKDHYAPAMGKNTMMNQNTGKNTMYQNTMYQNTMGKNNLDNLEQMARQELANLTSK